MNLDEASSATNKKINNSNKNNNNFFGREGGFANQISRFLGADRMSLTETQLVHALAANLSAQTDKTKKEKKSDTKSLLAAKRREAEEEDLRESVDGNLYQEQKSKIGQLLHDLQNPRDKNFDFLYQKVRNLRETVTPIPAKNPDRKNINNVDSVSSKTFEKDCEKEWNQNNTDNPFPSSSQGEGEEEVQSQSSQQNKKTQNLPDSLLLACLVEFHFQDVLYELMSCPIPWIVFEACWILSNATTLEGCSSSSSSLTVSSSYIEKGILTRALNLVNLNTIKDYFPIVDDHNNNSNSNDNDNDGNTIIPPHVRFINADGSISRKNTWAHEAFIALSEQCSWLVANVMPDHHSIRDRCLAEQVVKSFVSNLMPLNWLKNTTKSLHSSGTFAMQNDLSGGFPHISFFRVNSWALANCFRGRPLVNSVYKTPAIEPICKIIDCFVRNGIEFDSIGDDDENENDNNNNNLMSGSDEGFLGVSGGGNVSPKHNRGNNSFKNVQNGGGGNNTDDEDFDQYWKGIEIMYMTRIHQCVFSDPQLACDILWAAQYITDGSDQHNEQVLIDIANCRFGGNSQRGLLENIKRILLSTTTMPSLSDNSNDLLALIHQTEQENHRRSAPKLQIPAVRILGNYVQGSDNVTKLVLDSGVASEALPRIWSDPRSHRSVRKEIAWLISNTVASGAEFTTKILDTSPIIQMMVSRYASAESQTFEPEVVKEVIWVVANALCNFNCGGAKFASSFDFGGNNIENNCSQNNNNNNSQGCESPEKQIAAHLVNDCQVLKLIGRCLKAFDAKLVSISLEALEGILAVGAVEEQDDGNPNNQESENERKKKNPFLAEVLRDKDLCTSLDNLQGHSNVQVFQQVVALQETYFPDDDDDDDYSAFLHQFAMHGDNSSNDRNNNGEENGNNGFLPSTCAENVQENYTKMIQELEDLHIGEAMVKRTK